MWFPQAGELLCSFSSGILLIKVIETNQLELWPKFKLSSTIKPQKTLTKSSTVQNRVKSGFLKPGVILHSFLEEPS